MANNKPVVTPTASTQGVAIGSSVAVSSLFTVNDADGDPITQYRLTDSSLSGGYFEINGVRVTTKKVTVSAADLATTRYVAGTVSGFEKLSIQAYDGWAFGAKASFNMATHGPNPPVVTPNASTQFVTIGDSVAVSSLFAVNDADGDTITQYRLTDGGPGGGYFELNGVRAATPTVTVSAADLATTRYVAGTVPGSETLTVEASDGSAFGIGSSFDLMTRGPNRAPVVTPTASTQGVKIGGSVAVSSLFTVNDADGDTITQYRLTDTSRGGYFEINGVRAFTRKVTISAADLATTRYVAGTSAASETLTISASDGTAFGDAASFSMATRQNSLPVVTPTASAQGVLIGDSVAVSSLFTVNDPDGDAITQYRLTDGGSGGGYFELNGVRAATSTVAVSAADLATTRYVAGTVDGSETLTIEANDGSAFGAGASWSMQTFPPLNRAPVLTALNPGTVLEGTRRLTTSWFSVSDPDGDEITAYEFTDSASGGIFRLNADPYLSLPYGDDQDQGSTVVIPATPYDLIRTFFVPGPAGVADSFRVRAFDGTSWSAPLDVTMTPQVNHAPILVAGGRTLKTPATADGFRESVLVMDLYTPTDPDGPGVPFHQFIDNGAGGGFLAYYYDVLLAGVPQDPPELFFFRYYAGDTAGTETLTIMVSDGGLWTSQTVTMTTVVNDRPVVQTTDLNVTGQTFNASSLVTSVTDSDDSMFLFEVRAPSDLVLPQTSDYTVLQTGGGQTTYRLNNGSSLLFNSGNVIRDATISIRAGDGVDWSEWAEATVHLDGTGSPPADDNTFDTSIAVMLSPAVQTFHNWVGTSPVYDYVDYYRFTLDTQQTVQIQINGVTGDPITVSSFKINDNGDGTFSNGGFAPSGPQGVWATAADGLTASMVNLPAGTYALQLVNTSSQGSFYDIALSLS